MLIQRGKHYHTRSCIGFFPARWRCTSAGIAKQFASRRYCVEEIRANRKSNIFNHGRVRYKCSRRCNLTGENSRKLSLWMLHCCGEIGTDHIARPLRGAYIPTNTTRSIYSYIYIPVMLSTWPSCRRNTLISNRELADNSAQADIAATNSNRWQQMNSELIVYTVSLPASDSADCGMRTRAHSLLNFFRLIAITGNLKFLTSRL